MFKAPYYKADGKKGKAHTLPDSVFDGTVNESVMHQVVTAYLANQRQGTGSAKNRSAVRGGSRKPWRQKGTGRARQGTIRAVQWEGGGVAFPPIPHSWRKRVPRKVRALARRSALNARAEHERVIVADLPALEAPKTRDVASFLGSLELEGKTLILTDGRNETLYLSTRNLEGVEVMPFGSESVYDVLWANTVVIEKGALDGVGEAKPAKKAAAKKTTKKKTAAKKAEAETVEAEAAEPATEEAPEAEAAADETVEAAADETPADEAPAEEAAESEDDETEEKTDA